MGKKLKKNKWDFFQVYKEREYMKYVFCCIHFGFSPMPKKEFIKHLKN